jgi:hypothetical protein
LRVLASVPLHNPWIVEHRYRDKIALLDADERPLPFPPTNYLIVGEKISADQAIALEEVSFTELETPRFFVPRSYRNVETGEVLALAERPGRTLDIVPWFARASRVFTGDATLEVCPAFRLPEQIRSQVDVETYARTRMTEHGVTLRRLLPLGGPYVPSAGATPEVVTPFVGEIDHAQAANLHFLPLRELLGQIDTVLDGHLKISVLRLAHALGVST